MLNKDGNFVELKELEEAEKDSYVPDSDLESEILKDKAQNEQKELEVPSELEDELNDFDENEEDQEPTDEELKIWKGRINNGCK